MGDCGPWRLLDIISLRLIWYQLPWSYERITIASFIPDTFFFFVFVFFFFQGRQIQTALCQPLIVSYRRCWLASVWDAEGRDKRRDTTTWEWQRALHSCWDTHNVSSSSCELKNPCCDVICCRNTKIIWAGSLLRCRENVDVEVLFLGFSCI